MSDNVGGRRFGFWAFVVLMLALTALFAFLGVWQVERLAEKEALIATVASGMDAAPLALPDASLWRDLDALAYRPLTATGVWKPKDTVFVYTSLGDAKGTFGGPGFWVMTPLELGTGGTLFVNRGFIPQDRLSTYDAAANLSAGSDAVTGLGRPAEAASAFTPQPDFARHIEWVRDPARLAAFSDDLAQPVAPLTIDLPAGLPGALPQGGETQVSFPNNHFGYALTWFGFAILTPILLLVWIRRQRRLPGPSR